MTAKNKNKNKLSRFPCFNCYTGTLWHIFWKSTESPDQSKCEDDAETSEHDFFAPKIQFRGNL